jgi:hypothetical protein
MWHFLSYLKNLLPLRLNLRVNRLRVTIVVCVLIPSA